MAITLSSSLARSLWALTFFCSHITFASDIQHQQETAITPVSSLFGGSSNSLHSRQTSASTSEDYSCTKDKPCSNGACCGKSGVCGYGPTYCGDGCMSNCDATAECGQYSESGDATCPLNVCCSQYGFCGTTEEFCGTNCQSNCGSPAAPDSDGGDVRSKITGYYESWKASGTECGTMDPSQIPIEALDQVNFAFVYIVPKTYDLQPMDGDWSLLRKVADIKTRNPDAQVWISIGGWSFNDDGTSTQPVFPDIASSSTKSAKFADKVISFMNQYGFSGVDIDWEYPGAGDRGGTSSDKDNYPRMLGILKEAFAAHSKGNWGISITVPTSYWYLRWFNLEKLASKVDHFNLMAYDLHGTWDSSDPVGPYVYAHTNLTEIDDALNLFWRNDVDPSMINLGLAFYGRSFTLKNARCTEPGCEFTGAGAEGSCTQTAGILSYREIMELQSSKGSQYDAVYDAEAGINYMVYKTDTSAKSLSWVSYDDKTTFQQKVDFANKRGLRGLLIWAIDQDDDSLTALKAVTGKDIALSVPESTTYGDWNVNSCYISNCGDVCAVGFTTLFQLNQDENGVGCPHSGKSEADSRQRRFCCPPWGAPDPSTCHWRGTAHHCYGQCEPGEVLMALDNFAGKGSKGWCQNGQYAYCCPATSGAAAITACSKEDSDSCPSDKPQKLSSLTNTDSFSNGQTLCCPSKPTFTNCDWYGWPTSCTNNRCPAGQVEIYRDIFGDSGAQCVLGRRKVFCCDPPYSGTAFLPVELDHLFPDADSFPAADEPVYYESFDHSDNEYPGYRDINTDDPNKEPFAWTIMVGTEEDVQSLRRRDGSHLEAFECPNPDPSDYSTQTVKLLCMVHDDHEGNNCEHILKGGARGTIVRLPEGCGPDEWVRVVSFKEIHSVEEHAMPQELRKRAPEKPKAYRLRYDYNFRQLRRDGNEIYVRLDVSDHPGYWDAIVASEADTKKREVENWREFHMDWFEQRGFVDGSEQEHLATRGESTNAQWWLSKFNKLLAEGSADGGWGLTKNYKYSQVLYSASRTCPPSATASVTATVEGSLQGTLDFGVSLIGTLRDFDFTQSYAYFELTHVDANFGAVLDAEASIAMQTTVQPLQVDLDPWGGSFNIKGLWEAGPYVDVTAQMQAQATVSGRLSANSTIYSTDFRWMYPDSLGESPTKDTVQGVFYSPKISSGYSATISADGSVTMTLTPSIGFRVKLDALGSSLVSTDIKASFASALTFNVGASSSTSSSDCSGAYYGLTGGLDVSISMTAPLPGWTSSAKSLKVWSDTWPLKDVECYPWKSNIQDHGGDPGKRGVALEARASVVDALFPDINALNIACANDITSDSTGCNAVIPDNSDLPLADSVDQGIKPTLSDDSSTSTKRSLVPRTAFDGPWDIESLGHSLLSEDPDYNLTGDIFHSLYKRKTTKAGFSICKKDATFSFGGFDYYSSGDLLNGNAGRLAVPTAYTRSDDCDTYGLTATSNPAQYGSMYWAAEHVLEWQLVGDFWETMEITYRDEQGWKAPNPVSPNYKRYRDYQGTSLSWCKYTKFWWSSERYSTATSDGTEYEMYPTEMAGAILMPSVNDYGSELILLDSETNGFKERVFGEGNIRRPKPLLEKIITDPDQAINICRAVMNAVNYMKISEVIRLYTGQAQRIADRLDEVENSLANINDADYNVATYQKFDYSRQFKKFMYEQHQYAKSKVWDFLNKYIPELERVHLGGSSGLGAQGGTQTNQNVVDRIGLLLAEFNDFKNQGWDNPIDTSWR